MTIQAIKKFLCSKCKEPKRGQSDRYCRDCRLEYNIAYRLTSAAKSAAIAR